MYGNTAMFSKGDNFLYAYLKDEVFPKWGLLFKERICYVGIYSLRKEFATMGEISFPYEMIPMKMIELLPLKMYRNNFKYWDR